MTELGWECLEIAILIWLIHLFVGYNLVYNKTKSEKTINLYLPHLTKAFISDIIRYHTE